MSGQLHVTNSARSVSPWTRTAHVEVAVVHGCPEMSVLTNPLNGRPGVRSHAAGVDALVRAVEQVHARAAARRVATAVAALRRFVDGHPAEWTVTTAAVDAERRTRLWMPMDADLRAAQLLRFGRAWRGVVVTADLRTDAELTVAVENPCSLEPVLRWTEPAAELLRRPPRFVRPDYIDALPPLDAALADVAELQLVVVDALRGLGKRRGEEAN